MSKVSRVIDLRCMEQRGINVVGYLGEYESMLAKNRLEK